MKTFNIYLTAAILLLFLPAIAQHSYSIKKNNADSAWLKLEEVISNDESDFCSIQSAYLKYREEGLKFWKMFPNDFRKYQWLLMTVRCYVYYWDIDCNDESYKNILYKREYYPKQSFSYPLKQKPLEEWISIYPKLKNDFLANYKKYPSLFLPTPAEVNIEMSLIGNELSSFLQLSLNKAYRRNNRIDLGMLKRLLSSSEQYLHVYYDECGHSVSGQTVHPFGCHVW